MSSWPYSHHIVLIFRLLYISLLTLPTTCQPFSNCDIETYYSTISDLSDRDEVHFHIKNTHRSSLPYSSSRGPDVWDALVALDSDDSGENVLLVYSDKYVPAFPQDDGSCSSWNREHLWPRSRGVGSSGPDNTDVHHIRPIDCNVNSARANLLFGSCGTGVSPSSSSCSIPAHSEAAEDTEKDSISFLPPFNQRGDVARAILYMDLRYDGDADESNVMDLVVSDCPESIPNGAGMGYLSQLLQWHMDDPPDAAEKRRHENACENWQGNRNPFIDYPGMASLFYGMPKEPKGNGLGYDCSVPPPAAPPFPITLAPTTYSAGVSPSPPPMQNLGESNKNSCNGMDRGDVAVVGIQSVSPDIVVLLALVNLPAGATIYITDNAWTGSGLKTNEGVKKLIIPQEGIPAGTVFGYEEKSTSHNVFLGDSWLKESGSFALSGNGDNVMVYCGGESGTPFFLYASLYQNDWSSESSDPTDFTTQQSALPKDLPKNCAVSLKEKKRNWWYSGVEQGTKSSLLDSIADPANWANDNDEFDDIPEEKFDIQKSSGSKHWVINLVSLSFAIILALLLKL